ncbi:MAG: hypothetical protein HQ517_09210 [SAR324 cluster bacterium]|nr:hypothetical protein [SAR324 cluster bacterium]
MRNSLSVMIMIVVAVVFFLVGYSAAPVSDTKSERSAQQKHRQDSDHIKSRDQVEKTESGGYGSEEPESGGYGSEKAESGGYGSEQKESGGYSSEKAETGGYGSEEKESGGYGSEKAESGGYK